MGGITSGDLPWPFGVGRRIGVWIQGLIGELSIAYQRHSGRFGLPSFVAFALQTFEILASREDFLRIRQ